MEEASYSVTVKDRAGNLITVRGASSEEFASNLRKLSGTHIAAITAISEAANSANAVSTVLQLMPGSEVIEEQQLPASVNPVCKDCGAPTRYEEWVGKNGKNAGKQFKAYKCTRDKDHRPEWLN